MYAILIPGSISGVGYFWLLIIFPFCSLKRSNDRLTDSTLTAERYDVAAVCVDKLPRDRFLHDLLHLKEKYRRHSA
jgi:hypothetical protein